MKIKAVFFILSFVFISQLAFATPKCILKLGRGFEGLLSAPIEYGTEYQMARQKQSVIGSSVTALTMGTVMMGKRLINGLYDIVSFPVPYPQAKNLATGDVSYRLLIKDDFETALKKNQDLQNAD